MVEKSTMIHRRRHKKRAAKNVKSYRKWLVDIAGCVKYTPELKLIVIQMIYEWMYLMEGWRQFESFRVPRSLRGLWEERGRMERNGEGYVVSGEWPELGNATQWIAEHRHWHRSAERLARHLNAC